MPHLTPKDAIENVTYAAMSLYDHMKLNGVEIDNHESDLYVPVSPVTAHFIARYEHKANVTTFVSAIDGKLWYDIPFAYMPFWERKQSGAGQR